MRLNRKQQIEALLESMRAMRRRMTFGSTGTRTARITPAQWGVLMLVGERGECSVKDIAQALRVSSSAATQLIHGLLKGGYLVRNESAQDRRAVALSLSKQAKARMQSMKAAALQKTLTLFKPLNDRELSQYVALTKKISDHLSKKHHD